jgi:hypothetical protein
MKFIKNFESRYNRKFVYLNKEDNEKIKNFIINFIDNINVDSNIDDLTYEKFYDVDFNYDDIFEYMLTTNFYKNGNIYYNLDTYCKMNNIDGSVPKIRNSAFEIISDIKKKLKLDDKLDKKLISILEQKPQKYKKRFNLIEDQLTNKVKDACNWMLDYRKYNI